MEGALGRVTDFRKGRSEEVEWHDVTLIVDAVQGLRRQRDELHETTNRYLERARATEADAAENLELLTKQNDLIRKIAAERDAAEARERVKDEALKPFAEFGKTWMGPWTEVILKSDASGKLTISDLRRATIALTPETPHAE
jgi:hypothetical protein